MSKKDIFPNPKTLLSLIAKAIGVDDYRKIGFMALPCPQEYSSFEDFKRDFDEQFPTALEGGWIAPDASSDARDYWPWVVEDKETND